MLGGHGEGWLRGGSAAWSGLWSIHGSQRAKGGPGLKVTARLGHRFGGPRQPVVPNASLGRAGSRWTWSEQAWGRWEPQTPCRHLSQGDAVAPACRGHSRSASHFTPRSDLGSFRQGRTCPSTGQPSVAIRVLLGSDLQFSEPRLNPNQPSARARLRSAYVALSLGTSCPKPSGCHHLQDVT